MAMGRYIRKRLLMMLLLMLGMTFIVFASLYIAPGDPAELAAGPSATVEEVERMRVYLGLDKPFLVQYGMYLSNLLHGDLGTSLITRQPVVTELAQRLPYTINLAVFSMLLATIIGIPLGIISAVHHDSWLDNLLTTLSLVGISTPNFWLGTLLILFFCVRLGWFPTGGMDSMFWTPQGLKQVFLPGLSLSLQVMSGFVRIGRSSMLDVLGSDYIRTARSKGLTENKITWVHALRNALIPLITQMGTSFGGLLGGAIVTEQVFAINGIGTYLINGISQRNYPVVQSTVMVIAFMFILVNLIVDLLYCVIDPRIKYE
ncbi:MAG: ABC transporter permease [Bulleidia sp.]|nr:ABC transporter permease [Bulleidia sp.]